MESGILVTTGLISITLGAISGYALSAVYEKPEQLARWRIASRRRVRQVHLDWIIMGTVLVAVGFAVPDLSAIPVLLVLIGGIGNPLLFVPGIFSARVEATVWLRYASHFSYACLTVGLVLACVSRLT